MTHSLFQSLDWVERLSDIEHYDGSDQVLTFQSLDWVERLSDCARRCVTDLVSCFNPSTGLSVFQTH